MIEFVSALPHIVKIERPVPKGDWVLTHVDHQRTTGKRNTQNSKENMRIKTNYVLLIEAKA